MSLTILLLFIGSDVDYPRIMMDGTSLAPYVFESLSKCEDELQSFKKAGMDGYCLTYTGAPEE